jgi:hypothetical protein
MIDWKIVVVGIICITGLMAYGLSLGYNGTLLKLTIAFIGLVIGGFAIPADRLIKPRVM